MPYILILEKEKYDVVAFIFIHFEPDIRAEIHQKQYHL